MDTRAIGMFDSGVGGMTVYKEVKKAFPKQKIVYLGDTARFPYGSKSKETIIEITRKGIEFLIQKNVKLIIIACGTATSQALEEVKNSYPIPIIGIIEPTVQYIKESHLRKIGVIATHGTIRSNAWEQELKKKIENIEVQNKACPLLAPMAEEGFIDNEIAKLTIHEYLKDLKNIDGLILGCTHYPLFKPLIAKELGSHIEIINTGEKIVRKVKSILKEDTSSVKENVEDEIYLTDTECNFIEVVKKLLGKSEIIEIKKAIV